MRTLALIVALSFAGASGDLSAHHSFSAEFDIQRPVNLTGSIIKVDWVNPHSWIHVRVQRPDGTAENWEIEMGAPGALFRKGVTKVVLAPGTQVVIDGFRAKDGSTKANGRSVKFADGRSLFLSSSVPSAPPAEGAGKK